jgi:hypothetical protein
MQTMNGVVSISMTINDETIGYKEDSPTRGNLLSTKVNTPKFKIAKQSVSVAVTLLIASLLPLIARAESPVVRDGDRLSVDFHEAALGQVVEALKRDARIVVRLPASLSDRKITVSFENLEIGAATDKLLMSASLKSSAVMYAPGLRGLITVVVVEAGTSKAQTALPRAADSRAAPPAASAMDPAVAHDGEPLTPQMRRMLSPSPGGESDAPTPDTADSDE